MNGIVRNLKPELTSPHKHIHQHVEQVSLRSNWKWAETLVHQGCKKDPHRISRKGGEAEVWDWCPREGTQKGDHTGGESWEWAV